MFIFVKTLHKNKIHNHYAFTKDLQNVLRLYAIFREKGAQYHSQMKILYSISCQKSWTRRINKGR